MGRLKVGKVMVFLGMIVMAGCTRVVPGNSGLMQSYPFPVVEAEWIRNGESIIYDGYAWYPVDNIETLLDNEVFQIGEYRDVQFFVEKTDVKPYDRLYTKFDRNKFRFFEKR